MRHEKVWFGPRGRMAWVAAPDASMPSNPVGWSSKMRFQNGGARVRTSWASAKEYIMSWTMVRRDEVRYVMDCASGMFGTGPFYLADPFAMDKNALPMVWSFPAQSGYDGIILDNSRNRPQLIPTDANSYGYPAESAIFDVNVPDPGTEIYQVYVPIPPGYTAWVGAHGTNGSGGTVVCTPSTGPGLTGPPTTLTLLPVTTSERFNHSVDSTVADGILLHLGGAGTITLSGMMVQVLKTGHTPEVGGFISGQGHSGLSFDKQPEYVPYNAALDRVGVVAELTETESWRFVPNVT